MDAREYTARARDTGKHQQRQRGEKDRMRYLGLFDHQKGLPVDHLRIERVGRLYQCTHSTFSNFRFISILENVKIAYQSTNLVK